MEFPALLNTLLCSLSHDSLFRSFLLTRQMQTINTLLLVILPNLSNCQVLCLKEKSTTLSCFDIPSLTSPSHGKMTALISILVPTHSPIIYCLAFFKRQTPLPSLLHILARSSFRTYSRKRVSVLLPTWDHSSYFSKVWVSVNTSHDPYYTLDLFMIVIAKRNNHTRYFHCIEPPLHKEHQTPPLRTHY